MTNTRSGVGVCDVAEVLPHPLTVMILAIDTYTLVNTF